MSQARHQAVLVPLTVGLALDRLFSARAHGTSHGAPGLRELGCVSQFHGRATEGVADELWGNWRHLVRRDVGQTGSGLASRTNLRADSSIAAAGDGRQQSS